MSRIGQIDDLVEDRRTVATSTRRQRPQSSGCVRIILADYAGNAVSLQDVTKHQQLLAKDPPERCYWSFPGGMIGDDRPEETIDAAAAAEACEEFFAGDPDVIEFVEHRDDARAILAGGTWRMRLWHAATVDMQIYFEQVPIGDPRLSFENKFEHEFEMHDEGDHNWTLQEYRALGPNERMRSSWSFPLHLYVGLVPDLRGSGFPLLIEGKIDHERVNIEPLAALIGQGKLLPSHRKLGEIATTELTRK